MTNKTILVMAGGTGGHIYPALAVAHQLIDEGFSIVWLGTRRGLEATIVPQNDIPIEYLDVHGIRGKGKLTWFMAPFKLLRACYQAWKVVKKVQPSAVLGMGGFASGPGGVVAKLMGKPLVIHEQNAIAGLTNKVLAKLANRKLSAFPVRLGSTEAECVGNPVRQDIICAENQLTVSDDGLNVLVVGGSLGALALNQVVPKALKEWLDRGFSLQQIHVRHQTGHKNLESTQTLYNELGLTQCDYEIVPYIENMAELYQWADVVICRSGAMTVSELAASGSASILVPYPYAVDDHQSANAKYLEDQGAALLIQQNKLDEQWLANQFANFIKNKTLLLKMKKAALLAAKTNATDAVVNVLKEEML